ncbi:MAG: hypothetical protein GY913_01080 [Proteobacteria bacterium]|nr:hypothetical protein [Pseudomonadota bacterium]MCP4915491.1 hypothetical protein [Pseudomonadota bacterium]
MSHQDVARVTMRMLYDPVFARAVCAGEAELPELDDEERGWLAEVDERAWQVDPLRARRTLRALMDEFKGSSLLALAHTASVRSVEGFFQSAAFHDAVQRRGSMSQGFEAWLGTIDAPHLPGVLALEGGLARARRELDDRPERLATAIPGPWLARARGVRPLLLDGAALDTLNVLESWLFEDQLLPGASLASDAPGLPPLPAPRPDEPVHLLAVPTGGVVRLANHGRLVWDVLALLRTPVAHTRAVERVAALGIGSRAEGLLDQLVDAGLVTRGR